MTGSHLKNILRISLSTSLLGAVVIASTGCQSSINGQTLPSPYYLQDDVQYFPAGPEFKLSREAAALRAAEAEAKLQEDRR
ncbi:hypothetical protein FF011L_38340 [Roseimaritima multifibrata]|uniref:Uncharacterized protein n=1 Tax=Roseimaritima multifibrata TaxID=1930274 RepID=A0A517MJN3_9BACT|nr:hypothetical protein [Roseimaritima multifibrata]QDS95050.1 hypothetical protein FF011L_38340 [Roseimaritima multifibrata]